MVTNGGYGGVQHALSYGLPLVVAGTTEDKLEVSARVVWSGTGINLRTDTPTPTEVLRAVQTLLSDPRYRQRAQTLQAEYARFDAISNGVTLIEHLASTGQPVLRTASSTPASKAGLNVTAA
jgi:UDP:flavonoid glycosyltransferase YjiC (YdhE family)